MANTFKFGNGEWAVGKETALAYNDENNNFKPLLFSFDRGSIATVVNKDGLIETVATDEPRIDFLNNTKGHLLLEPARTNLVTYSEDFTTWGGSGYMTSNYAISPDGTQNASRCLFTGGNQILSTGSTLSTGVSCSATIYVKGVSGETIQLAAGGVDAIHILNGSWQRIETNATSINSTIVLNTYGGATARDLLIWGAQLEEGSYATSYIPTSGSAVTRSADVCNNAGNSNVFNDSEGVLYWECSSLYDDLTNRIISISQGNQNNTVQLYFDASSNRIRGTVRAVDGTYQCILNYTVSDTTDYIKAAIKYKQNDFALWVNGVERATDASGSAPTGLSEVSFDSGSGSLDFYGKVKDLRVYNTALSDSELQALTQV